MSVTANELAEIERANQSGLRPVVFVHGLWLLSSSWDRWRAFFEEAGFTTIAPGWPDDPESIEDARANPDAFASKMVQEVTDHYLEAIAALTEIPAVVGHSFGGLIAQKIAGTGVSGATVAIDPAPFQGVLSVPASSFKSSAPVVSHPGTSLKHGVTLSFEEFQYGWANALDEDEARRLYDEFHVAAAGNPIFQVVMANLNPFSETKVDTKNPDRGPLLIIGGELDHTVPVKPTEQAYKIQSKNPGVTDIAILPNRGHSLTIDHGWAEVAKVSMDFIVGADALTMTW
ncbi:alpha/beta hydrolase [Microbacterium deminutum]|uniref:Alpha/beta fold hydrolase n=1 Tax=Microbacterium deminutum TaxID=344164 RepID=A0ABN2QI56_9MICO